MIKKWSKVLKNIFFNQKILKKKIDRCILMQKIARSCATRTRVSKDSELLVKSLKVK